MKLIILKKVGIRDFIKKIIIYLISFIIISVILGPLIVNTVLLNKFFFFIYGGLGYLVIFMAGAFILFSRKKLTKIRRYRQPNLFLWIPVIILTFLFYLLGNYFSNNTANFLLLLLVSHVLFLSIFISLALAVFGYRFLKYFIREFKRQLIICIILSLILYAAMFFVWRLWPLLSDFVTWAVYKMFKLLGFNAIASERYIKVNGFSAVIAEPCSGVYSMFLFSTFYLLILFLDWRLFDKKKAIFLFFPAFLGVFLVNILRVFLLIYIGAVISPKLSRDLFHSYLGMVLFVLYFMVFWFYSYRWMKK